LNRGVLRQLKALQPGDLVCIAWFDASVGSSRAGAIDVPVDSWGIYLGVLGEKNKHFILAQNSFRYSNGLYDVDYTAVPVTWTTIVKVLGKAAVDPKTAKGLLDSFLAGRSRTLKRRIRNHG